MATTSNNPLYRRDPLPSAADSGRCWHPAFREAHQPAAESRAARAEWFLLATLALDVPFSLWPRLLTTYGGF